eukprot:124810-Amphidinium_carterae.1
MALDASLAQLENRLGHVCQELANHLGYRWAPSYLGPWEQPAHSTRQLLAIGLVTVHMSFWRDAGEPKRRSLL